VQNVPGARTPTQTTGCSQTSQMSGHACPQTLLFSGVWGRCRRGRDTVPEREAPAPALIRQQLPKKHPNFRSTRQSSGPLCQKNIQVSGQQFVLFLSPGGTSTNGRDRARERQRPPSSSFADSLPAAATRPPRQPYHRTNVTSAQQPHTSTPLTHWQPLRPLAPEKRAPALRFFFTRF
jgi:hypothetical protein